MMLAVMLIFVPLLLVEAFFAASEISLISASYRRLRHRAEEGQRGAKFALKLLDRPERLVATCLLGSNLAEISNTILVTAVLVNWLGGSGELIAMLLLPPLILLLMPGDVLSKIPRVTTKTKDITGGLPRCASISSRRATRRILP